MTLLRLIDRMCPAHAEQGLTRWPAGRDWQALRDRCNDCRVGSQGLPDCAALPDLPAEVFERAKALHEAAHAIAALEAPGVSLTTVEVWPGHEPGRDGGNTALAIGPRGTPAAAYFTILWAGQEAAHRYLIGEGFGSDANRLDLRFLARGDAGEFDFKCAVYALDIPADTGVREARDLVDNRWGEVCAVADELLARLRLTGGDVSALLDGALSRAA